MLWIAQAASETPDKVIPAIWTRWDALCHPEEMVAALGDLTMVWAGIFVAAGLVCLLQGYKLYKWVVVTLALALGGAIGYQLGQHIQAEVIVAGCLGVLLAVVAWPFMKFAVAAAGGFAGAVIGANAWSALADQINANSQTLSVPADAHWAGALMGLLFFGMLSFILFELSVVVFTSFSGSMLLVMGAIALLLHVPAWQDAVGNSLKASPLIVPVLVIVPAMIGLVIQHHFGGLKTESAKG
jgi:hypothetical protein